MNEKEKQVCSACGAKHGVKFDDEQIENLTDAIGVIAEELHLIKCALRDIRELMPA